MTTATDAKPVSNQIHMCIDCQHIGLPTHHEAFCANQHALKFVTDVGYVYRSTTEMRATGPCGPEGKLFEAKT